MTAVRVGYLLRYLPSPSETFVFEEARALREAGVDVRIYALDRVRGLPQHGRFTDLLDRAVFAPRPSSPRSWLAALDPPGQAYLGPVVRHWRAHARPRDFRRAAWLAARWRSDRLDAIRVHHAAETGRFAVAAGVLAELPVSLAVHARDLFVPTRDLNWILRTASHVTTLTPFHRESLLRLGLPSAHVALLPCIVRPVPRPARPPAEDGPIRILSVGRCVAKKGHDILLEACARLAGEGSEIELEIVGDGPLGPALRGLGARLSSESRGRLAVTFHGAAASERVHSLLADGRFHAFALACRVAADGDRDGVPVSLLEAQAHGVPAVSTALPGFESEFDPERGVLLVPLDADSAPGEPSASEVAAALRRIISDPALRKDLAEGGRAASFARPGAAEVAAALLARLPRGRSAVPVPYSAPPPATGSA